MDNERTETLVSRVLINDPQAKTQLFDSFKNVLFKHIQKYVKNFHDTEDILQDVFCTIFQKLQQWDQNRGSFLGWICKIATNKCLTFLNKKQKLEFQELNVESNNYQTCRNHYNGDNIQSLLTYIPSGQSQVLILNSALGYKHDEIAQLLNIHEGTSRSQLFKAKRSMQKIISKEEELVAACAC